MIKSILKTYLAITILVLGTNLLTGCIASKYVEQKQYLLDIKIPAKHIAKCNQIPLYIDRVTAVAPFDQLNFLYKINAYRYLTDYYNGFLVPPTQQLETALIKYLKNSSNFIPCNTALTTPYILKAELNEFYADYSNSKKPQAVISINLVLVRTNDNKTILDRTFVQKIILPIKNTESLLSAWHIGLQTIITTATKALDQCIK